MKQEIGETTTAILEDDQKRVEAIIEANKDRKDTYWIVIFAKHAKGMNVEGKPTIVRHFKAHYTKPRPQVGLIIGEVNNTKGTINWEVNMPDKPFGFELLGLENTGAIVQETSIPNSYIYN